jgi:glycosyltransferase involved in cell wall biosynthesis
MIDPIRQFENRARAPESWRLWLSLIEQAARSSALERQLVAMKQSRSWRLTAPLRALLGLFRRRDAESQQGSAPAWGGPMAGIAMPSWLEGVVPTAQDPRPRWLLDVTELANEDLGAGVQRVTRRLLGELLFAPPDGHAIEAVRLLDTGEYCLARGFLAEFLGLSAGTIGADEPVVPRPGDRFVGLDFCRDRAPLLKIALDSLRRQGVHISLIVHDTLPLTNPQWFPEHISVAFESWLRVLSTCADQAVCVSLQTATDLGRALSERGLQEPVKGIAVITLGADLSPAPDTSPITDQRSSAVRVLTVGTLEPRKGHAQALDAFETLWDAGESFEWVIVGRPGWHVEPLIDRLRRHSQIGHRLHWFEDADDRLLLALYKRSDVLLAPSQGEGFGLPVAEAGRLGLGLVLRDLPVFQEVAGNAADYFDGDTPGAIANALRDWNDERRNAERPQRTWATWAQSAESLKSTIASVAPPTPLRAADGRI